MVSKEFLLNGKTALVAGDGRFWSKSVAVALAEAGADVAIAVKNSQTLEEAAGEVRRQGRKAVAILADVTRTTQVQKMVEEAVTKLGKIDILVNTTDLQFAKPFVKVTDNEWYQVMEANLTSVFHCCQAVGKHMLQQKKGRIINVTSHLAERGLSNSSVYCAAMGGVLQITRALALEWAREGIRVNAIGAGWFSETEKPRTPEEASILGCIPLKRYGQPSEIGSLVVYLASDISDYLTGQLLRVDGGAMGLMGMTQR